jgi:regulator of sigma E protease
VDGRTGTAAEAAGLKTGDHILAVNDHPVQSFAELQETIVAGAGRTDVWTLDRDGTQLKINVTPKTDANGRPLVGVYPFNPPRVKDVEAKSPAAMAGFEPGDLIVAIDGLNVNADQLVYARLEGREPSHTVDVERGGTRVSLTFVSEGKKTPVGLIFAMPSYPAVGLGLIEAVQAGFAKTIDLLSQMINGLGRLFVGKENAVQSLSGPVGIVGQGSKAIEYAFGLGLDFGIATMVNFLSFLSLALFLMNLLPIPALDGGSIVVSLFEMVRRKRLGIRALMVYQQVGVVLVLGLLLFTTLNDFGLFGKV